MVGLQAILLAAVLSSPGDVVLYDFSADWCGPCRLMQPTVGRLEQAGYPVRRVNIDREPQLAQQFSIQPIPCFVLVANGREVGRVVGPASFDRLAQMFHQVGYRPGATAPQPTAGAPSLDARPPLQPVSFPSAGPNTAGTGGLALRERQPSLPAAQRVMNPMSMQAAQQRAIAATVRLKVTDPNGASYGTGTIVDTHGEDALVVTCGHLFRDSRGQGTISVEMFAPGATRPVPGQLVAWEAGKRDVGLVSFRPGISVTPVQIAPPSYHVRLDDPVFNIGCDHGARPTMKTTAISSIDRYLGPPNLEVRGHPVEGRSGGGLFSADGMLIGICNAADLQEDRGIYAGLPSLYLKLDEVKLAHIYRRNTPPRVSPSQIAANARRAVPAASAPTTPVLPASATAPAPGVDDLEVICIVRSRSNPNGPNRVVVLDRPSPQLLQSIVGQQRPAAGQLQNLADLPRPVGSRSAPRIADRSNGPIVRAQNR